MHSSFKLSLYFRFFEESGGGSSLCQKLWTAFLLSLLPPSPTLNNFRVHLLELMDSLMSCCLDTIKQNNTALIPYSVGYDSEEETVDFSKSSYQNLLDANLRMVSQVRDYISLAHYYGDCVYLQTIYILHNHIWKLFLCMPYSL